MDAIEYYYNCVNFEFENEYVIYVDYDEMSEYLFYKVDDIYYIEYIYI